MSSGSNNENSSSQANVQDVVMEDVRFVKEWNSALDDRHCLEWRSDTNKLSDWKIEILLQGNKKEEPSVRLTAYVHRAIIAYGTRRCAYFTTLCENETGLFAESMCRTSRIEVSSQLEVEAFSVLLDFVYEHLWSSRMTLEMVPIVYELADRIGNGALQKAVQTFLRKYQWSGPSVLKFVEDMKSSPFCEALVEPLKSVHSLIAECAFRRLWPKQFGDARFWISVLEEMSKGMDIYFGGRFDFELTTNELTDDIIKTFASVLTVEEYKSITNPTYLPEPGVYAFNHLVHHDIFIDSNPGAVVYRDEEGLTRLQKKCLVDIGENWLEYEDFERAEIIDFVSTRPVLIKAIKRRRAMYLAMGS